MEPLKWLQASRPLGNTSMIMAECIASRDGGVLVAKNNGFF